MKERLLYNKAIFGEPEKQAVNRVLESDWLSGHKETVLFEQELAEWWGVDSSVTTNSGSSANFIAIQALGLPKGSEVITPAGLAFPTTISPLVYHGLKPVFIDVEKDGICLDLEQLDRAVSDKTKAIVFAHTLGFSPNMDRLITFAKDHDLKVLEDCCDAVGSEWHGQPVGTFGDIATVSFYPAHHMTTGGEGGAILTNNPKLVREARAIRDWGRDCVCKWGAEVPACRDRYSNPPFDHRYYYTRLGMNLKMTEMQAAFGREQIKRLDGFVDVRRRNYNILAEMTGRPKVTEESPFCFPVLHPKKEEAMAYLNTHGIHTRTLFTGNILEHPAYKNIDCRVIGDLPNSNRLLREGFFVGVGPHLTEENMHYIGDKLKEV